MERSRNPAPARRCMRIALVAGCLAMVHHAAADDSGERERLATVVRQLDLVDRLAKESAASASPERARYHFDYPRLAADLQRVRTGINDYLTPRRAQPRDATALPANYRKDSEQEDPR